MNWIPVIGLACVAAVNAWGWIESERHRRRMQQQTTTVADDTFPGEEPSADHRRAADLMRQMFVALVQEGFTRPEALFIVGTSLGNANSRRDQT